MTIQFISKALEEMKIKRAVGSNGLPSQDYRGSQTKIRQTEGEDLLLRCTANCMGETPAQLANAALKLGLRMILEEDEDLYREVLARIKRAGYQVPKYLIQDDFVIEGEFKFVSYQPMER
jgi:hypothetical protein